MDVNRRRGGARSSVVPGSVWESRMKSDEVRGGIKVFNGEENSEEGGSGETRLKRSPIGGAVVSGKRKTWKSESSEGFDRNQILIAREKSETQQKNCDEQCKKSPIGTRKNCVERSPILRRKLRSETPKGIPELETDSGQQMKSKSDSTETTNQNVDGVGGSNCGNSESSIQLRKAKLESDQVLDESKDKTDGEIEKVTVENGNDPDGICEDFSLCQEKPISSSLEHVGVIRCSTELSVPVNGDSDAVIDDEGDEDEEEEHDRIENEIEKDKDKNNLDLKETSIPETKIMMEPDNKKIVKEPENKKAANEPQPKKVLSIQRRFQQNERPVSTPLTVKQPSPIKRHARIYEDFRKSNSIPRAEKHCSFPQTRNKLQSLVDLIMWRDASRSAFVFGIGTFIIVSSSYAEDINVSSISVMSYFALVYLAVIFLYRSFICRGVIDLDSTNYGLREEEAIRVLKLILPYFNEFLLKLRALFSGDPGTTMKLAILLFVLAKCGSSITIWKMAKFGFFGVFTVPKIYSLYSAQLTAYANFWVRRFRDAWDSCSHKKALSLAIFGLVWNLTSLVARIWAVFVLFVALRYYQQNHLIRDDEWVKDEVGCEETWHGPVSVGEQRRGSGPSFKYETNKVKKEF